MRWAAGAQEESPSAWWPLLSGRPAGSAAVDAGRTMVGQPQARGSPVGTAASASGVDSVSRCTARCRSESNTSFRGSEARRQCLGGFFALLWSRWCSFLNPRHFLVCSVVCDARDRPGVARARERGGISTWLALFRDVSAIKTEAIAPPMIRGSFTMVPAP